MKKISICVACYNEEKNVELMANTLISIMDKIGKYDYEIIFRDNASTDGTVDILRRLSENHKQIKVIVNSRNYGVDNPEKNTFIGRVDGDVLIFIPCDFQEPPELIPEFIKWWEQGYEVVAGIKTSSQEGKLKYRLRKLFYRILEAFSDYPVKENLSGIILVSRRIKEIQWHSNQFIDFRYFITDLGCDVKYIEYEQQKRKSGKSSYNLSRALSFTIKSLLDTSLKPLRLATILGFTCSVISFLIGLVYLILKIVWWNSFSAGTAPILIGIFFIGSILLFFIGIVGEYIGSVLRKVTPVIPPTVKELINFDNTDDPYYLGKKENQ